MKKKYRLIAMLLGVCLLISVVAGCTPKPGNEQGGDATAAPTAEPTATPEPRSIAGETPMAASIVYANEMANKVRGYYDTAKRNLFYIENANVRLKLGLTPKNEKGLQEIQTASGKVLLSGGMTGYAENLAGERFITTNSSADGRVNTSRMGYYYYEMNLRDLKFKAEDSNVKTKPNFGFEQTFHTYSDKLHNDVRILYDAKIEDLKEFGYEYKIPADTVEKVLINAENGNVTEVSQAQGNINYIAFAVKDAGLLGFILPGDNSCQCRIQEENGYYKLNVYRNIEGKHSKQATTAFGHRIYTAEDADFDAFEYEAYNERNPLQVTTEKYDKSSFKYSKYDTTTGAYTLTVSGTDFGTAYRKANHNKYYGGTVTFQADGRERKIYVCSRGQSGCLEAATLLDENNMLIPILPEVCKNFCGEMEEKYYDPQDTQYGDTIYPLVIDANSGNKHTMLNVYQKWGTSTMKQISSIAFHIGYYHLSTGATESNCIAPYYVFGRDGWTLPDFRGCSGNIWSGQPQYNSVGRLRFFFYNDGTDRYSEYTYSDIKSSGPVYADIDYSYKSYDESFEYTLSHKEFPQDDENRTYYRMSVKVLKDVTIENVKKKLTLFNFDGRFQAFKKTAYLDENGNRVVMENKIKQVTTASYYTLNKGSAYISLYNFNPATGEDIENFGLIIKDYNIVLSGKKWDGNLCFRLSTISGGASFLNLMELTMNEEKIDFKAGDTIVLDMILLPFGVKNQDNDNNVLYVYEDSVKNPWKVSSVTTGEIVEDPYLARVKCANNVAEFTVTGSRNANAVRVDGFEHLGRPKIQELVNGSWEDVVYNVKEFDGYQVNFTEDGYFSYSFIVNMENYTDERTFRVTVG